MKKFTRNLVSDVTEYGSIGKSVFFGTRDLVRIEMNLNNVQQFMTLSSHEQTLPENLTKFMAAIDYLMLPYRKIVDFDNLSEEDSLFSTKVTPQIPEE